MCQALVQPLAPSPSPRWHELARPDTGSCGLGLVFLGYVRGRIAPVRQRPTLLHQPTVQIYAVGVLADPECTAVAVRAVNRADYGPPPDQSAQRLGRLRAALVARPRAATGLLPFRGVDAQESYPLAGHNERIPIDHPCRAADNICVGRNGRACKQPCQEDQKSSHVGHHSISVWPFPIRRRPSGRPDRAEPTPAPPLVDREVARPGPRPNPNTATMLGHDGGAVLTLLLHNISPIAAANGWALGRSQLSGAQPSHP